MKKYFTVFILSLFVCQVCFGQNADKLFSSFSKEKNATSLKLRGFVVACMKPLVKDLKGVNSIKVLDLSNCSPSVKEKFDRSVESLNFSGYETFIRSNREKEGSHVLVKIKKNSIKELLVITTGASPCMVKIKGNIKQSHFDKWTN